MWVIVFCLFVILESDVVENGDFAKTTRFCSLRGTAVGAAPLREQKPVRFPCPAGLDIVEPHVQIEEEAVSTDPEGIY